MLDGDEEGSLPATAGGAGGCGTARRSGPRSSAHPDPFAQALLEQVREAGVVQMADRVRAVWHERLVVIATDVPVDLDVDLLVTQGELMTAAKAAAEGARALRRARLVAQAEPAARGGDRIRRTTDGTLIDTLLGKGLSFAEFPPSPPTAETRPRHAARHAAARRGLPPRSRGAPRPARAAAGGRRACASACAATGWCRRWTDLPALVPDLAPDRAAAAAIKDAEQAGLEALKAELAHAAYRVAGRRGRAGVALWDPIRVAEPAAVLTRLLGAAVAVEVHWSLYARDGRSRARLERHILVGPTPAHRSRRRPARGAGRGPGRPGAVCPVRVARRHAHRPGRGRVADDRPARALDRRVGPIVRAGPPRPGLHGHRRRPRRPRGRFPCGGGAPASLRNISGSFRPSPGSGSGRRVTRLVTAVFYVRARRANKP